MSVPGSKMRADAQANRGRILDVAREAFTVDPNVSLNAVAKQARVGAGTLYRHFPTREALLVGVYRREIDALVALAPTLLQSKLPATALRSWCERFAAFGSVKHSVADTLNAAISERDFKETYWPLVDAVGGLMSACEKAGSIIPGTCPEDVLVLLSSVLRIAPTADGRLQVMRVLALLFRGLGIEESVKQRS